MSSIDKYVIVYTLSSYMENNHQNPQYLLSDNEFTALYRSPEILNLIYNVVILKISGRG
jgi:hypothetical protein